MVFRDMFGTDLPAAADMAGRTDRAIVLDTLARAGIPEPRQHLEEFLAKLAALAPTGHELAVQHSRALPGAAAALDALAAFAPAPDRDGRPTPGRDVRPAPDRDAHPAPGRDVRPSAGSPVPDRNRGPTHSRDADPAPSPTPADPSHRGATPSGPGTVDASPGVCVVQSVLTECPADGRDEARRARPGRPPRPGGRRLRRGARDPVRTGAPAPGQRRPQVRHGLRRDGDGAGR